MQFNAGLYGAVPATRSHEACAKKTTIIGRLRTNTHYADSKLFLSAHRPSAGLLM